MILFHILKKGTSKKLHILGRYVTYEIKFCTFNDTSTVLAYNFLERHFHFALLLIGNCGVRTLHNVYVKFEENPSIF